MVRRMMRGSARKTQLELDLRRKKEPDRNYRLGGRSFYFFDFDDNVAMLSTLIYIFHKETGRQLALGSGEFAENSADIGTRGIYKDYEIDFNEDTGSFRDFRDRGLSFMDRLKRRRQVFIEDLREALEQPDFQWKGPSWDCFYHAVYNRRPISLITARGHAPDTLKEGIQLMADKGHLVGEPNYLSIYPVNNPEVQEELTQGQELRVPQLKQAAIRASVEKALATYGYNPFHRFGMSDDDPKNIELIIEEMSRLKSDYPPLSFFVIETHKGQFIKHEVFENYTRDQLVETSEQLSLF